MEKEVTGIINAFSNFVTPLDAHQVGGAMFVCCLAMLLLVVVVFCLSWQLRTAAASHNKRSS